MAVTAHDSGTFTPSVVSGSYEEVVAVTDAGVYVLAYSAENGEDGLIRALFASGGIAETELVVEINSVTGSTVLPFGPFVVAPGQTLTVEATQETGGSPVGFPWVLNRVG